MKIKECVLIEAFKCNEKEKITEVAKKLREISLRHIFVVNDNDYPVGIISVIDINNRVVAEGKNPKTVKAKDIMTKPIDIVDYDEDINSAYKKMAEKNHVIDAVIKDNKMIGIITIHQILKNINKI